MSGSITWEAHTFDAELYYGTDDIERDVTETKGQAMDEERITRAIYYANLRFWEEVGAQIPEVMIGDIPDIPLGAEDKLRAAMGDAIRLWVKLNAKG